MKEIAKNLHLELRHHCLLLLELSSSLPRFRLSQTVWVKEIWVRGVCLLHGLCLGLISPVCSFFVVCFSSCFLFGFLPHVSYLFFFFVCSGFLGFFLHVFLCVVWVSSLWLRLISLWNLSL